MDAASLACGEVLVVFFVVAVCEDDESVNAIHVGSKERDAHVGT